MTPTANANAWRWFVAQAPEAMLEVEVTGADQLAARLASYADGVESRVTQAMLALANMIADDARANILRQRASERPLPSRLAESVFVRAQLGSVLVGASAPYATLVEFGTRNQPAEPFLFPAVLAAQDQFRPLLSITRLS